jgi:hypothetical protein
VPSRPTDACDDASRADERSSRAFADETPGGGSCDDGGSSRAFARETDDDAYA